MPVRSAQRKPFSGGVIVDDGDHYRNLQLLNRFHLAGALFQLSLFIHDNLVPDLRNLRALEVKAHRRSRSAPLRVRR
jgi:hypothetical protein